MGNFTDLWLPCFLVLLTLVPSGLGLKVPLIKEGKLRHLLYKAENTADLLFCKLCTQRDYQKPSLFQEDCYRQNSGRVYKLNGVDYRPWCRRGLVPACPKPQPLLEGWLECQDSGTRVYSSCQVRCPERKRAVPSNVTCLEEDLSWSAAPICVFQECPPLRPPANVSVQCGAEDPFGIGAKCNVSCPMGFRPDKETLQCQDDGTWSSAPRCDADSLPIVDGGKGSGYSEVAIISMGILMLLLSLASLIIILIFIWYKRRWQRAYNVRSAEYTLGVSFSSGMELPTIVLGRPQVSKWTSFASLFRLLSRHSSQRSQRSRHHLDGESGSEHSGRPGSADEEEELEMRLFHSVDSESEGDSRSREVEDGGKAIAPPQEEEPLLPHVCVISPTSPKTEDDPSRMALAERQGMADHSVPAGNTSSMEETQAEAELHGSPITAQHPEDLSPDVEVFTDRFDPDGFISPKFERKSHQSRPSDKSEPTYEHKLREVIAFKVTFKNGNCKATSSLIEKDTEVQVAKGQEISISALCQDHDDEVECFSVTRSMGTGAIVKETTGNSFWFQACLTADREVYCLQAQSSRTRRNHIVILTVYTLEIRQDLSDPEETFVKQPVGSPPRHGLMNIYSSFPTTANSPSQVSNSDNQTFAASPDKVCNTSADEMPGKTGSPSSSVTLSGDQDTLEDTVSGQIRSAGTANTDVVEQMPRRELGWCNQPLCELLQTSSLDWMTQLHRKLEPISSRKTELSIRGLFLHYCPTFVDYVDHVCWARREDLQCSPAHVLLERLSQEGLTTGHLVHYFADSAHPRPDVLHLLHEAHTCQSCLPYFRAGLRNLQS